jgi:hypothetical protein
MNLETFPVELLELDRLYEPVVILVPLAKMVTFWQSQNSCGQSGGMLLQVASHQKLVAMAFFAIHFTR